MGFDRSAEEGIPSESDNRLIRYALAFVFVGTALTFGFLLGPDVQIELAPMLFIAAVVMTAWFAGTGPGLAAVLISTVLVEYFWIEPRFSIRIDIDQLPWFITFVLCGFVGLGLSLQRRAHERELTESRNALEAKVAERTAELEARMEDWRRAQSELARASRFTTMGVLTASIAHEINQPLSAIVTNGQAGLRWLDGPAPDMAEARATLGRIIRDANRAASIIISIRQLLEPGNDSTRPVSLNQVIRQLVPLIDTELAERRIELGLDLAPDLPEVAGNAVQLQQLILNLVMNALDSLDDGAADRRLAVRTTALAGEVMLIVEDGGSGLVGKNLERLFEPFFTTKEQGMGMGLAICRAVAEAHGGRIWAEARAPAGARFAFALPTLDHGGRVSRS